MARMRASVGDRIEIRQGDYRDAPDMEATWFIDPPYQHHGSRYYHGSSGIDYPRLAEWAQSRTGQVIVCEASPADWLPFVPFVTQQSLTGAVMTELIWESDPKPTLFDKPR